MIRISRFSRIVLFETLLKIQCGTNVQRFVLKALEYVDIKHTMIAFEFFEEKFVTEMAA